MKTTNMLGKRAALIAVLVFGSSAWLNAQSGIYADPSTNTPSTQVMNINKCSSLIGTTVKNQQGEELGKIHDLVINFNSDRVAYVVLDSQTKLLSSAKLHAVPLRAFQPNSERTFLILNADKDKLARSEGFNKDNWPAMTTAAWGAQPFWTDTSGISGSQAEYNMSTNTNTQSPQVMKINRGSSLIGTTVKNQQGEALGKIYDLVIDFNSDRVAYVVLDSQTKLFSSSKLHAVPLRAFQSNSEGTSLVMNADKNKLALAEGFSKDNWPAVTTAVWGAEPFWKDIRGTSGSQQRRDRNTIMEPKSFEIEPHPQP